MFVRYSALIVSLLMVIFITIAGVSSLIGGGDKSFLAIISIDIYYAVILFYWRKYDDPVYFKTKNRALFVLSIIPLILAVYIFYKLSGIEC